MTAAAATATSAARRSRPDGVAVHAAPARWLVRDPGSSASATPASKSRKSPANTQWVAAAAANSTPRARVPFRPAATSGATAAAATSRTSASNWSRLPTAVPTTAADAPSPTTNAANAHRGSRSASTAIAPAARPIATAAIARSTTVNVSASVPVTAPSSEPRTGTPGRSGTAPVGIVVRTSTPPDVTARVRQT